MPNQHASIMVRQAIVLNHCSGLELLLFEAKFIPESCVFQLQPKNFDPIYPFQDILEGNHL